MPIQKQIVINEFGEQEVYMREVPPEEDDLINQTIELLNDDDVVVRKSSLSENVFLIGSYVLAGVVTLFTFIWGIL